MDKETLHGRVVAERVYCGRRYKEPSVLSAVAHKPDFRLVPKEEEESFCQWDKIKDYDPTADAPRKPKYLEMPPLLKEVIRRRGGVGGAALATEAEAEARDYRLHAHKIYTGDVILEDEVQPHSMRQFLDEKHSTYDDFDVSRDIPKEWGRERYNSYVGRKRWMSFDERSKFWEKQEAREKEWEDVLQRWRTMKGIDSEGAKSDSQNA